MGDSLCRLRGFPTSRCRSEDFRHAQELLESFIQFKLCLDASFHCRGEGFRLFAAEAKISDGFSLFHNEDWFDLIGIGPGFCGSFRYLSSLIICNDLVLTKVLRSPGNLQFALTFYSFKF